MTEDAIVLSLGETHSFPLEEVAHYLNSHSVRAVLVQALLDAPLFTTRWRWVANLSLAVKRFRGSQVGYMKLNEDVGLWRRGHGQMSLPSLYSSLVNESL